MLNVHVPVDRGMAQTMRSPAFALATPLRVRELLALAVAEALGKHAPPDRRERVLDSTLAGFSRGDFSLEIDGRVYADLDGCVVCGEVARLRFFRGSSSASRRD